MNSERAYKKHYKFDDVLKFIKNKDNELIDHFNSESKKISERERLFCANEIDPFTSHNLKQVSEKCKIVERLFSDVDTHLKLIEQVSNDLDSVNDYAWLLDTAVKWEYRLSDVLHISRPVSVPETPEHMLSTLRLPEKRKDACFSESELNDRVEVLANIAYVYSIYKGEQRDSNHEELMLKDWHRAEVFLANDMLNGIIDFAHKIKSYSYYRLENIWMAEIRELAAYLNWEQRGAKIFDDKTTDNYLDAWNDFQSKLKQSYCKASVESFGEVKRYLEKHYLTYDNQKYTLNNPKIQLSDNHNLVKIKSIKIKNELDKKYPNKKYNQREALSIAEEYVKLYYENIIPAVFGDQKAANEVINAFNFSMSEPYRIINAFEMAIAIYFINSEVMGKIIFPVKQNKT